jgi:peptidoglycan/xylan/chitin deacetylase (PgdA/CDA1 family)
MKRLLACAAASLLLMMTVAAAQLQPVPDKLVVLTLDDSKASHYTVVRPLLKKYGFGATFFITEGFSFATNKEDYLTWEQIAELHREGFEIGNHTRDHKGVSKANLAGLREQVEAINAQCAKYGIPAPVSFAYPGNTIEPGSIDIIEALGFRFARRGGAPEYPYEEGNGVAYEPGLDHPLLLPSAGDARPSWTLDNLKRAVSQAKNGKIAILQFHGAPDVEHPWVHTPPERFAEYMKYLHDEGFTVIALRDLAKYVDWRQKPADPWKIIEQRKSELARQGSVVERPALPERYTRVSRMVEAVSGKRPATDEEVYALLLAGMKDPDVFVRSESVGMVANLVMVPSIPQLASNLEWIVARRAVGERLWPELDAAADDPEPRVRTQALRGIAGAFTLGLPTYVLPSQIANRLLDKFERDPSQGVRSLAVSAFQSAHRSEYPAVRSIGSQVLLKALDDSDPYIVATAAHAIPDWKPAEALPLLVKHLKNPSLQARMAVAQIIAAYREDARPYIPQLEAALAVETDDITKKTIAGTLSVVRE